jgi:hypothetical protein
MEDGRQVKRNRFATVADVSEGDAFDILASNLPDTIEQTNGQFQALRNFR